MDIKTELGNAINEVVEKELSTVNKWIYKIGVQILIDIFNGLKDSIFMLNERLCAKEIKNILKFFDSLSFTCRVEYIGGELVFHTYWEEED